MILEKIADSQKTCSKLKSEFESQTDFNKVLALVDEQNTRIHKLETQVKLFESLSNSFSKLNKQVGDTADVAFKVNRKIVDLEKIFQSEEPQLSKRTEEQLKSIESRV